MNESEQSNNVPSPPPPTPHQPIPTSAPPDHPTAPSAGYTDSGSYGGQSTYGNQDTYGNQAGYGNQGAYGGQLGYGNQGGPPGQPQYGHQVNPPMPAAVPAVAPPAPSQTQWGGSSAAFGQAVIYGAPNPNGISTLATWASALIATFVGLYGLILIFNPLGGMRTFLGFSMFGIFIASVIVTMVWMYRISDNLGRIGRHLTFGPLWAIFSWFLFPFFWIVSALQLNELWKVSDPRQDYRQSSAAWKVWTWFATAPVALLPIVYTLFAENDPYLTEWEQDRVYEEALSGPLYFYFAMTIAAAALFIVFMFELTRRHEQLLQQTSPRPYA